MESTQEGYEFIRKGEIMEKTYHEKVKIENELKLREMTKELPRFCQIGRAHV